MSSFFAAVYDPFMRRIERACLAEWRRELLAPLHGAVLEVGAGTGANVPFYPRDLKRLILTENDDAMLARLRRREALAGTPPAEILRASADALPFDDGSFDFVVSTLVLCSVPDVPRVLAEVRRVLRPDSGVLIYLEHVAADSTPRLRWQRRLEPLWSKIAGNCHLTRDTHSAIEAAGFTVEHERRESMRKALPIVRATIRGAARVGPRGDVAAHAAR